MYRKIRITAIAIVLAVICIASSSGTLSYFTDTDDKTSEFVVGRVASELSIYKDTLGTEFEVDKPWEVGEPISYYLQAENIGNIDAYQRFRIVIPIELKDVVGVKLGGDLATCDARTAAENTCESSLYKVTYDSSVEVDNEPTYAEYYI